MLTHLDRIVLAVRERRPVVRALQRLLDAELVSHGPLPVRAAERTVLRAGIGEIEVLSPKGVGPVADFIGRNGPGVFAVGFATDEMEKFRSHLEVQAVSFEESDDQLLVTSDKGADLPGLNLVFTAARLRGSIGRLQRFCGATLLHRFVEPESLLRILGVHHSQISRVETTGFTGSVIHLGHGLLNHLAILAPSGLESAIARSFYQRGPGIYQVSAVTEQQPVARKRLATRRRTDPCPSADGTAPLTSRLLGDVRLALLPSSPPCSSRDIPSSLLATPRVCD